MRRGTIHALIGPNGAGKTTCFNLLTKFLEPTRGQIIFKGRDITGSSPPAHRAPRPGALVPDLGGVSAPDGAGERAHRAAAQARRFVRFLALASACSTRSTTRARELLDAVGLAEFAETVAVELPYGRKRALEIATTLALDPEMMLLDEPTAGMGHEDVDRITALIKRVAANRTVLMVEHNLERRRRRSADTHHRAAARRDAGRGRLRRRCRSNPEVIEAYMGTGACLSGRRLTSLLAVKDLQAWYGESHILHGVDFDVREGEVVTLLGRNGAGKTTTLQVDHGHRRPARRARSRSTARETIELPSAPRSRGSGIALLPGGARHLREPRRGGEPAAAAAGRPRAACRSSRSSSCSRTCSERADEPGHQAVRRRAADAGDRRASCAPARGCCCSTSRPRAWRRSSSSRSAASSAR